MELTIPYELVQSFEKVLGKEKTGEFVKFYNMCLEDIVHKADDLALQKKLELKDELIKELATKADVLLVKAEIQLVRGEIQFFRSEFDTKIDKSHADLENKIDKSHADLENKIDKTHADLDFKIDKTHADLDFKIDKVEMKLTMRLNLLIILMIIALTFMNPVVAKIISNWLNLGL